MNHKPLIAALLLTPLLASGAHAQDLLVFRVESSEISDESLLECLGGVVSALQETATALVENKTQNGSGAECPNVAFKVDGHCGYDAIEYGDETDVDLDADRTHVIVTFGPELDPIGHEIQGLDVGLCVL